MAGGGDARRQFDDFGRDGDDQIGELLKRDFAANRRRFAVAEHGAHPHGRRMISDQSKVHGAHSINQTHCAMFDGGAAFHHDESDGVSRSSKANGDHIANAMRARSDLKTQDASVIDLSIRDDFAKRVIGYVKEIALRSDIVLTRRDGGKTIGRKAINQHHRCGRHRYIFAVGQATHQRHYYWQRLVVRAGERDRDAFADAHQMMRKGDRQPWLVSRQQNSSRYDD